MYNKSKTAIVYLGMNTKKDLLYKRDSRSMLEKSLDLLYKNYNNKFKHDIIIFYDSKFPFDIQSQNQIKKNRNEIKFIQIPDNLWKPPDNININNKNNWVGNYPVGYRNMCRWYGILIFKYIKDLGYDWILRLDDDAYIHSNINYDIFEFMHDNNKIYGYRCLSKESINWRKFFIEEIAKYILQKKLQNKYEILLKYFILNQDKWESNKFNLIGPYTNFFITNVNNWINDNNIVEFLEYIDNMGGIYKYRWGDLIIHTAVINIFFHYRTLHQFNDFDYEHATYLNNNKFCFGGFFPRLNNNNIVKSSYYNEWLKKNKKLSIDCHQILDINNLHTRKIINCPIEIVNNINNKNYIINNMKKIYLLGSFKFLHKVLYIIQSYLLNNCLNTSFKNDFIKNFIWDNKKTFNLYVYGNESNNLNISNNDNNKYPVMLFTIKNNIIITS